MTNLTDPIFHDDDAARRHFEAVRWQHGPVCPHCGNTDQGKITELKGKSHRPGLRQCNECREHFTVTVGSVMERSHIPLSKWALGFHLMASSKKGISAHQLFRTLGLGSYRTAWFMAHRIREAMRDTSPAPIGGEGQTVEADETYYGKRETPRTTRTSGEPFIKRGKKKAGPANKRSIVALVERGGNARTFHIRHATAASVRDILVTNVPRATTLYTDESRLYTETGREYEAHETVRHSAGEYVRGIVHTNTVENVFSVLKRGMRGVYQHCGEAHLHRYLAEFTFRYNHRTGVGIEDTERAHDAIRGAAGKRLTYQQTGQAAHA